MAVMAFGMLGAYLAPAGYVGLGYALGSMVGGALFPQSMPDGPNITQEGPRLGDTTVQNSAYGIDIPVAFNTIRFAGNIIWASEIKETQHVNTYSSGGGGGKGGGGGGTATQITYTYAVDLGIGICQGPITRIKKIWANSKLIYDVDGTGTNAAVTIHLGTEVQTADSYIQSIEGSTYTPAYRGLAYVVFQDYQLAEHGNTIPNFEFEVEVNSGTQTLGGIVEYLCGLAGLSPSQIDVSALTQVVKGFKISNRGTIRQALEPLMTAYYFDCVESEGILKFVVRGNPTPAYIISEDDLDARMSSEQPGIPLNSTRLMEMELPYEVSVVFMNLNNSYQSGLQYDRRLNTQSNTQKKIELPIAMLDSKAKSIASTILFATWIAKTSYEFKVSRKYTALEPTDPIVIQKGGINYPMRITAKDESLSGVIQFKAESEDSGMWNYTASSYVDIPVPPIYFVANPGNVRTPVMFDAPRTTSATGNELIIAACGQSVDWGGCRVWMSLDGLEYSPIGIIRGPSTMGVTTTLLANVADPDLTSTLGVDLSNSDGELTTVSTEAWDAATTTCWLDGEVIAYKTATLTGANTYNLTSLHRGLYASTLSSHLTNLPFVAIDGTIFRYAYKDELLNTTIYLKFTSFNTHKQAEQALASVIAYEYTLVGTAAEPPPAQISGLTATASSNSVFISYNAPSADSVAWTEIWGSLTNDIGTAEPITTIVGEVGFYADYIGAVNITKYYWARTVSKNDYTPSAFVGSVSAVTDSVIPGSGVIVEAMIAADAVTAGKIKAGEIAASHIAANAITASKIDASAVTTEKLNASSVTAEKIGSSAITTAKLDALAVTTAKIAAGAISAGGGKIGDLAVDTLQIAGSAVSVPVGSYTSGEVTGAVASGGVAVWTDAQSVTITAVDGQSIFINAACGLSGNGTIAYPRVRIRRGSTTIFGTLDSSDISSATGVLYLGTPNGNAFFGGAWNIIDTPGAGTYTYYLQFATHQTISPAPKANLRSMYAVLLKK